MNNEIGSTISIPDQILLLADEDGVMSWDRCIVGYNGELVPVTEEVLLGSMPDQALCTVISGAITPCTKSVIRLTEAGKTRVSELLESPEIRVEILKILTQARHSLHTLAQHIGRPFSESHIRQIMHALVQKWEVQQLPISGAEIFALKNSDSK
jgi:uncharacterized protein YneF (UPF0154 family)